jgi:hypothetical protein
MPTVVTKTVKASGGDYSSLAAWNAGRQGDLTVRDTIEQAECYGFVDTSACDIGSSWVTDATRYVRVYAPASERHQGVWNEAKYVLQVSVEFGQPLVIGTEFARVEGLQVRNTHANAAGAVRIHNLTASGDVRFEKMILRASATYGFSQGILTAGDPDVLIRNCIIYDAGHGVRETSNAGVSVLIENCTIVSNGTASSRGIYRNGDGTLAARNCYCGNAAVADYDGTMTLTTCASSDATGTSGLRNIAVSHSAGALFVNVTSGSENFHLQSSSPLIGAGTNLAASFTDDIDGQTRSRWDIGADEAVVQDVLVPQICL